ncbi:MAG TPA: AMP-binding protein, partial [Anaerolineales bacterium]|nr:AMP-binding protein [Anaerolineales bacterium]
MRLNPTIPLELKKRSEAMPAASALLAPGRRALSYGELWTEINRHVRELCNFGLVGSRIAVVLPNGPEMAVAFLAVASTAAFAPLNPTFRSREFDF